MAKYFYKKFNSKIIKAKIPKLVAPLIASFFAALLISNGGKVEMGMILEKAFLLFIWAWIGYVVIQSALDYEEEILEGKE